MKTFLDDLKKELKKRHFSKEDIEEILADHKEMIETAKNEGLSDDELASKFGDPAQLADDLLETKPLEVHKGGVQVEGYQLFQTFQVLDKAFNVAISLVSEDVKYLVHDKDQIEVHYKNIKDIEDYTVTFDGTEFVLRHEKSGVRCGHKESGKFVVKVPKDVQSNEFALQLVSGDAKVEGIQADQLKVNTTSGDVTVSNFTAKAAKFNTVSGDLTFHQGTLDELDISMVSGDCKLLNVAISGNLGCNTVSGDLKVENSEAADFVFKTVSGDCKGQEFYPKTVSFRSVSGDMKIKNSDNAREIKVVRSKALSGKVKIG